ITFLHVTYLAQVMLLVYSLAPDNFSSTFLLYFQYLMGSIYHLTDFFPLFCLFYKLSFVCRIKPSYCARKYLVLRLIGCCFHDTFFYLFFIFQLSVLRSDQTKHNMKIPSIHMTDWLKSTGAFIIIFQKQTINIQSAENLF